MNSNQVKDFNPRLFWDGVCRGTLTYSEAGALPVGNPVTSPFTESFLGGPHAPVTITANPASPIIGASDSYPKPWRSASQKLQDASHGSLIGPFARLVRIPEEVFELNTCCDALIKRCGGADGGIYGRLGIGDGVNIGFRAQGWYSQDEGSYDTAYYNNQGANWPTWKEWWANGTKETITAIWEDMPGNPLVEVEILFEDLGPGDAGYFPGPGMSGIAPNSYDLLVAMVALAVLIRW